MSAIDTKKLHIILSDGLSKMNISLDDYKKQQLVDFVVRINKWNKAFNLTSVRDPEQMMIKHVLDSLSVVHFIKGKNIIDVGTGPGLPGIPLAIAFPDKSFTLLDSLGKRIRFITQTIFELKIENVTPIQCRVESHIAEPYYDIVLSRAFASLKDMLHWCEHLVDSEGKILALKGQYPVEEINELEQKYSIVDIQTIVVPGLVGDRHIVTIQQ